MNSQVEELQFSKLSISEKKRDGESYAFQNGPLREEFLFVQCPFTWTEKITFSKIEDIISSSYNLVVGDPKEWNQFCLNLYFAYCYARLGKMDKATENVELCQEQLSKNVNNDFYKDIFDGLDHALKATVAHIHFLMGDAEKADNTMAKIIPEKNLNGPCRGALIAIHATTLHFFDLQPKENYLAMMEAVTKLDPDENGSRRGAWYFIVGKLHGQIRRINYRTQIPSKEELQLLERATKHNPFPVSLATLAESYREAAWFKNEDRSIHIDESIIDKLNSESHHLLKAACEMDDNDAGTLRRCGNGLMKLPRKYQDIHLARKCLEKSVSMDATNAPAYQALGGLEERHFRNLDAALKYYQLSVDCGNILAALSLMRVRYKRNNSYNPLKDCDNYIKIAENERDNVKAAFLVAKGEYYLFVAKNLILAAKEWEKAIALVPKSDTVLKHWKLFQGRNTYKNWGITNYINVYECLKNAIKEAPPASSDDQAFLNHLLKICEKKT